MRRVAVLVSLVALALASAALAAERNPLAEKERLNARDGALARAVAAKRADLGRGWKPQRVPPDDGPPCKSFAPDLSRFTITGKAHTMFADARGSSVQSMVEVYASAAQAAGDFAAGARPEQVRCLREALAHAGRKMPKGMRLVYKAARVLPAPAAGERSAAYRLVGTLRAGEVSLPLYMDLLVVQRGRMIVGLLFTGLERPVAGQLKLARKLAARMR